MYWVPWKTPWGIQPRGPLEAVQEVLAQGNPVANNLAPPREVTATAVFPPVAACLVAAALLVVVAGH